MLYGLIAWHLSRQEEGSHLCTSPACPPTATAEPSVLPPRHTTLERALSGPYGHSKHRKLEWQYVRHQSQTNLFTTHNIRLAYASPLTSHSLCILHACTHFVHRFWPFMLRKPFGPGFRHRVHYRLLFPSIGNHPIILVQTLFIVFDRNWYGIPPSPPIFFSFNDSFGTRTRLEEQDVGGRLGDWLRG